MYQFYIKLVTYHHNFPKFIVMHCDVLCDIWTRNRTYQISQICGDILQCWKCVRQNFSYFPNLFLNTIKHQISCKKSIKQSQIPNLAADFSILNVRFCRFLCRFDSETSFKTLSCWLGVSTLFPPLISNIAPSPMSTLSVPIKIFFHPSTTTSSFLHFQSQTKPQTVTFIPRRTPTITACSSASENPQRQQEKQQQQNTKKTASDGAEKGIDPAGFLAKRGISHKAFGQFLRERQERLKKEKVA